MVEAECFGKWGHTRRGSGGGSVVARILRRPSDQPKDEERLAGVLAGLPE